MKKGILILAIAIALLFLSTGCIEEEQQKKITPLPEEPIGFWQNATEYRWVTNGTCCGEKQQIKQEYILQEKINNTRWVDTNRTRDNLSMLPADTWYQTGIGTIYTREEEFRKHICVKGECVYSIVDTRWKQTGVMIVENISKSNDISIVRGETENWYFVIEPVGEEKVDIIFKIVEKGNDKLPIFTSHDMRTEYHSGSVKLPEKYMISIMLNSGKINVYVLDKIAYDELF